MRASTTPRLRRMAGLAGLLMLAGSTIIGQPRPAYGAPGDDRYHAIAPEFAPQIRSSGENPFTPTARPGERLEVDVRRGYFGDPVAAVPTGATAVWVRVSALHTPLVGVEGGGGLLAHPCERAPDTTTDGVIGFPGAPTTEVLLPITDGQFCLSATVLATNVGVAVLGYVDTDPSGAAWVDVPDQIILELTVSGTATTPLDLGRARVPAGAAATTLWWYGTATSSVSLTVAPCSGVGQGTSTTGSAPGYVAVALWAPADSAPCVYSSGIGTVTIEIAGYFQVGVPGSTEPPPQVRIEPLHAPGFVASDPVRLFDTRTAGPPLVPGTPLELSLADLPASTTAVVMNVTATDAAGPGFVTVWPCAEPQPLASNLNFAAGQTVANAVMVGVGNDRRVCFASLVPTHLLADLAGRFQLRGGHGYVIATPSRLFDTRERGAALVGGGEFAIDLTGIVDDSTSSVVLNVTATQATAAGYVAAYPCGTAPPLASSLNLARGATVPNLVTVKVPTDKRVCFTSNVTLHLLADLVGWYSSNSTTGFVDVTPARVFDTRDGGGSRVPAGAYLQLTLTVRRPAWVLNATVTDAVEPGYLTGHDCTQARPTTSNLNYVAGQTVPNLVIVKPHPALLMCFYAHGSTHVLADLAGFFTDEVFPRAYLVGDDGPG